MVGLRRSHRLASSSPAVDTHTVASSSSSMHASTARRGQRNNDRRRKRLRTYRDTDEDKSEEEADDEQEEDEVAADAAAHRGDMKLYRSNVLAPVECVARGECVLRSGQKHRDDMDEDAFDTMDFVTFGNALAKLVSTWVGLREESRSSKWTSQFVEVMSRTHSIRDVRVGQAHKAFYRKRNRCIACGTREHRNMHVIDMVGPLDPQWSVAVRHPGEEATVRCTEAFHKWLGDYASMANWAVGNNGEDELPDQDYGRFFLGTDCHRRALLYHACNTRVFELCYRAWQLCEQAAARSVRSSSTTRTGKSRPARPHRRRKRASVVSSGSSSDESDTSDRPSSNGQESHDEEVEHTYLPSGQLDPHELWACGEERIKEECERDEHIRVAIANLQSDRPRVGFEVLVDDSFWESVDTARRVVSNADRHKEQLMVHQRAVDLCEICEEDEEDGEEEEGDATAPEDGWHEQQQEHPVEEEVVVVGGDERPPARQKSRDATGASATATAAARDNERTRTCHRPCSPLASALNLARSRRAPADGALPSRKDCMLQLMKLQVKLKEAGEDDACAVCTNAIFVMQEMEYRIQQLSGS